MRIARHDFRHAAVLSPLVPPGRETWVAHLFSAVAVRKGGVVRRSVADTEREIGRDALIDEVRRRGFHILECGGQFVIICNDGPMTVIR